MTIVELEKKLHFEDLNTAHVGESVKQFVKGEKVFVNNAWENMVDVFGVYSDQDGRYCFFITDSERGIPEYSAVFNTEEEACEALYTKIARAERIYLKNHN